MKRKYRAPAAAAAVLALVGGGAFAASGLSANAEPPVAASTALAIFNSAPLSAAQLAASPFAGDELQSLSQIAGATLDPLTAHLTSDSSSAPWVIRDINDTKVCLTTHASAGQPLGIVCDNTGGGVVGPSGLFGTFRPAPSDRDQRVLVTGVMPDGVSAVTLHASDGSSVAVKVVGNGFDTKLSSMPTSADLVRGSNLNTVALGGAK